MGAKRGIRWNLGKLLILLFYQPFGAGYMGMKDW